MVPAIKVNNVIDTTGCGDSFAGGIGYGLLENPTDYIGAAGFGNALGALRIYKAKLSPSSSLSKKRKEIIKQGFIMSES